MATINRKREAERLGVKYSSFSQEPDIEQFETARSLLPSP
jgi:hypothetical protein